MWSLLLLWCGLACGWIFHSIFNFFSLHIFHTALKLLPGKAFIFLIAAPQPVPWEDFQEGLASTCKIPTDSQVEYPKKILFSFLLYPLLTTHSTCKLSKKISTFSILFFIFSFYFFVCLFWQKKIFQEELLFPVPVTDFQKQMRKITVRNPSLSCVTISLCVYLSKNYFLPNF